MTTRMANAPTAFSDDERVASSTVCARDDVAMWRCGDVAMWRRGDVAAWRRGDVAAWRRGGVAAWRRGGVAAWRRGGVAAWRRGGVAAWRRGGVAAWRRGGVAAWRRGGVAAWRRGGVAAHRHAGHQAFAVLSKPSQVPTCGSPTGSFPHTPSNCLTTACAAASCAPRCRQCASCVTTRVSARRFAP
ncbi:hypothetical protein X897_4998 [Burkholderia pseudomallei ABCPW 30]|nr:hypothetical protein X897_4998 [Burkholderia pseudomallei ABCPW 30]